MRPGHPLIPEELRVARLEPHESPVTDGNRVSRASPADRNPGGRTALVFIDLLTDTIGTHR